MASASQWTQTSAPERQSINTSRCYNVAIEGAEKRLHASSVHETVCRVQSEGQMTVGVVN